MQIGESNTLIGGVPGTFEDSELLTEDVEEAEEDTAKSKDISNFDLFFGGTGGGIFKYLFERLGFGGNGGESRDEVETGGGGDIERKVRTLLHV